MTAEKLTKRARRKLGANPSQAWPQMPKIQSATARANAYLRVAGLNTKIKAAPLDPEIDLMNSPEVKFGRLLASTEQRVRHEAVRRLNQYLSERCVIGDKEGMGISELDLLKLWKALWHTLYMADRVPVQDELSKHLAELIWCVAGTEEEDEYAGQTYLEMYGDEDDYDEEDIVMEEISNTLGHVHDEKCNHDDEEEEVEGGSDDEAEESEETGGDEEERDEEEEEEDEEADSFIPHCRGAHLAALFVKTFFQTIRREWGHMDKYRVDKFYTLIRLMMEQVYSYMAKRHWNLGIVRLFNDTIHEEILARTPNGLRLHLVDLSLHELAKVNANAPMPLTEATLLDCLGPYVAMTQACDDKVVQGRVIENVLLKFLNEYSVVSQAALDETEEDNEEESLILDQVHVGTIADFIFQMASDNETRDDYRESLYETYKLFKRRLKEAGTDVALDQQEEDDEGLEQEADDDEDVRFIEVDDPITLDRNEGKKRKHDVNEEEDDDDEETEKTKKKKKKKKDKKKRDSLEITREAKKLDAEDDESKSSKKSRKKLKKSKEVEKEEAEEEEVISISVAAQKRAKEVAEEEDAAEEDEDEPTKKSKKKKKKKSRESLEEDRRVSFGRTNHSKSHKASMRALKTMEQPKPAPVSSDKSILRVKTPPKSAVSAGSGKKGKRREKGRKKAVDYF